MVVFDLDGTLYDENTTYAFLERYHRAHGWWRSRLVRSGRTLPGRFAWRVLGRLARRDLFRAAALRSLRGEPVERVLSHVEAYVDELAPKAVAAVMARLEAARSEGARLVLASASLEPVACAVARRLRMSGCIASKPQAVGGRYTGAWADDVRGRKLVALRRAYPDVGAFAVVTDNPDDDDLIAAAERAAVVVRDARAARRWAAAWPHVEIVEHRP